MTSTFLWQFPHLRYLLFRNNAFFVSYFFLFFIVICPILVWKRDPIFQPIVKLYIFLSKVVIGHCVVLFSSVWKVCGIITLAKGDIFCYGIMPEIRLSYYRHLWTVMKDPTLQGCPIVKNASIDMRFFALSQKYPEFL